MYQNYGGYQGNGNSGYGGQQPGGYNPQAPPGGYNPQAPPGGYNPQAPPGGYNPQGGFGGPSGHHPQGGYSGQAPPGGAYPLPGGHFASPEIQQWFNAVDKDRSGRINARELQAALINGEGKNFSDVACNLMIGMFDYDKSGTIDINEFQKLYDYINQWLNVFKSCDRDQSGHIEEQELNQALSQMGFRFSPKFIQLLITKSDLKNHRQMSVDQFIVVCVQIQRFTEAFRSRDKEMKGIISLGFEDFLSIAISGSI